MASPQPLQKKVNRVLLLVALTSFFVISISNSLAEYGKIRKEYFSAMQARIRVARSLIKEVMFSTDGMVQFVMEQAGPHQLHDLTGQLALSRYFSLPGDTYFILDPGGRVISLSPEYAEYKGLDFSTFLQPGKEQHKQVYFYQSLLTTQSVVAIQYPLNKGYTLVVERSLDHFTPVMASFSKGKLYDGELLFILTKSGRTVYHPDFTLMATRFNFGFALKNKTVPDTTGRFSFSWNDQKFMAIQEVFTQPSDWVIYYCIPWSVLIAALAENLITQVAFLLFFFSLLAYVLQVVFTRFFSQPAKRLVESLAQPGGEKQQPLLSSQMSAGILEFDAMIEAINSRDRAVAGILERFQSVLDSLDALVYVADMETYEVLFLNKYGRQLNGDCVGKICYRSLQVGQENPCAFCTNSILVDGDGVPTGVHVWESQSSVNQRWYERRDQAISWTNGRLVRMEIATDITARKLAEEELMAEKERLAVTLRSIGDAVITTNINGEVLFINKAGEALTGWSNEKALGRRSTEVFHIINEKTGEECASPVQRVMQLGRIVGLANHTALISRDGTVRSIADSGAPIRDWDGQIIGVVLVFRDITHEKRMEDELLKVMKLESIGVLAGGIAHDFNNILAAILGNIELVSYRLRGSDAKTIHLLTEAEKATKRATKLTQQLLTFSQGGDPVREITSLPSLIKESAEFVLHGSRVGCTYSFAEDLWSVDVDSGQIGQVIQNIVLNGKQAMPEGGVISIECTNITDAAPDAFLSVDTGHFVRISLTDKGIGIPREIVGKIFDPYFTTKQEGSGLGLAICHSIINKHDGYLTVNSTSGKGTTFTIYLPAIESVDQEGTKEPDLGTQVKAAKIMIMDDEKMILDVTGQQLALLGHKAVLVMDGHQAINRYQELQDSGTPVDLVIMDLTIPGGMGGKEAARKLLQIDPQAKIVVASGYSNDPVMANFKDYGFVASITKPYNLQELHAVIAAVL